MSNLVANYITTNTLPCRTWIDATDVAYRTITGNTFSIANRIGNPVFNFVQNNPSLHPIIGNKGITFASDKKLEPASSGLITQSTNSYTMIFVTSGDVDTAQQLLSVSKANPAIPKLLDIKHQNGRSQQSYARVNVENSIQFDSYNSDTQILVMSHDVRLGNTSVSINNKGFTAYQNTNKGYILDNYSSIYLGNSVENLPFTGELLHFLLFVPAISEVHCENIANLLGTPKPSLPLISDDFRISKQAAVSLDVIPYINPNLVYRIPLLLHRKAKQDLLDLTVNISLSFFYTWDGLDNTNWDNLSVDFWNNLQ